MDLEDGFLKRVLLVVDEGVGFLFVAYGLESWILRLRIMNGYSVSCSLGPYPFYLSLPS